MNIDIKKWDNLIEKHYLSACKRISEYPKTHSRKEMKDWWYGKLDRNNEEDVEVFIKGSTYCNNNGLHFHPA